MNTEYIITAQVKHNSDLNGTSLWPELDPKNDDADWKVCSTYESAKSWTKWFQDRYKFVYVRECGEPLNVAPNPAQCRAVDLLTERE